VIGSHTAFLDGSEAVFAATAPDAVDLWSAPAPDEGAERVGTILVAPGDRFPLLDIDAGPGASEEVSAEAYRLWYRIALADEESAWVQAAVPSANDIGSDGRPSSVRFDFLPAVVAD
jgi:hypothetical protein